MLTHFSCPFCLIPIDHPFWSRPGRHQVFICIPCQRVFEYLVSHNELRVASLTGERLSRLLALRLQAPPRLRPPHQSVLQKMSAPPFA